MKKLILLLLGFTLVSCANMQFSDTKIIIKQQNGDYKTGNIYVKSDLLLIQNISLSNKVTIQDKLTGEKWDISNLDILYETDRDAVIDLWKLENFTPEKKAYIIEVWYKNWYFKDYETAKSEIFFN